MTGLERQELRVRVDQAVRNEFALRALQRTPRLPRRPRTPKPPLPPPAFARCVYCARWCLRVNVACCAHIDLVEIDPRYAQVSTKAAA